MLSAWKSLWLHPRFWCAFYVLKHPSYISLHCHACHLLPKCVSSCYESMCHAICLQRATSITSPYRLPLSVSFWLHCNNNAVDLITSVFHYYQDIQPRAARLSPGETCTLQVCVRYASSRHAGCYDDLTLVRHKMKTSIQWLRFQAYAIFCTN